MSYQITADKYLTPIEQQKVRAAIPSLPEEQQVLMLLALATGARESELLNITAADLVEHEQAVQIRGLKGSLSRVIPLQPELYARLACLCSSGKPFKMSDRKLRHIWHDFRPVVKKFHSFRHTFAIELYKKTKDIRLVQVALGHKSINNTMVYMQLVIATEDLRKALL